MSRNIFDLMSLKNKIAVVTGGAGLYGFQISEALAEAGANVVIASRNKKNIDVKVSELKDKGYAAQGEYLDLMDEKSIYDLRDKLVNQYGHIDILFNNALGRCGGSIEKMTREQWEESMEGNATSLFTCCRAFGMQMVEQKKGSIINISSIYGMVGPDFNIYEGTDMCNPADYAFVKGGMITFTKYLATYFGKYNVRVNAISPGGCPVDDEMSDPPRFKKQYALRTPLGRMAEAYEIKGAALFLASDASSYVTGINLPVDGGWTAQ